jgi:hypothetical protein
MKKYGIGWYEQGCGEPRWKTSMIFLDMIHAKMKKRRIVMKANAMEFIDLNVHQCT